MVNRTGRSRYGRLGLALGLVLVAGCQTRAGRQRPPQPRELPFPSFEERAPFPEYERAAAARARAAAEPETALQRELAQAAPASADPERQRIPIGATMTAAIPTGDDWAWATADGVTIASYGAADRPPSALVYVEAFSPEIRQHPALEHLRFQATVSPELAEGYLELATARAFLGGAPRSLARKARLELARGVALMATRTRGQGLGFSPTRGTFTGWRWVGRNVRGVTIRCGRHLGLWTKQGPMPEAVVAALRQASPAPVPWQSPGPVAAASSPGPSAAPLSAYAVLGSVTDRDERSGAHFVMLCMQEPKCRAYRELADFLGSIELVEPTTAAQVVTAAPMRFTELMERVQLSLSDSSVSAPSAGR